MDYYRQSITQILATLQASESGLAAKQVKKHLDKYGENVLPRAGEKVTRLKIFLEQWKSSLLLILTLAGIISGILGEFIDMTVIFITVGVNAIVGFFQEDKANRALSKLRNMVAYKALVIRNGRKQQISSAELVPGDILLIEAGDKIQADGRILEQIDLQINEATLTGEAEPIIKNTKIIKKEVPVGDRVNMVFRSTVVVNGRAKVLVTTTGGETEVGKIAKLIKTTHEESTPLQDQLSRLAKVIGIIVLFICLGIFLLGVFNPSEHHGLFEMFETAIAVAVAAIPEGLVISLTVILAIGMQHILKRNALVRKLVAAETLGSVSVICTDKTGTLTEGKMRVTRLIMDRDDLNFEELGVLDLKEKSRHPDAYKALRIGVLANNGLLENPEAEESEWQLIGDTTDTGLLYAGMKAGLQKQHLEAVMDRLAELPFDSSRKFMATLHKIDGETEIYVKGASEVLLKRCEYYEKNGEAKKLTEKKLAWFKEQEKDLTSKGLRVLALAYKVEKGDKTELAEKDIFDLVLVGLVALSDPLRPDVKETIDLAKRAGIRVVMITGDHLRTAQSIGADLGIPHGDEEIIEGQELEVMSDDELCQAIKNAYIFARVDPKHKIRIVQAFQANGEVVAMTGDGVNDAPALKGADIGVALGSGTDVAKETSDIVLMDDNFSTIVGAVEEGRGIYQNIKKVVLYLLSGSLAEVILIAGCLLGGLPLAVSAVQILWVNLIEDSFPNMALAFDRGDKENMSEPPRRQGESLIDKEMKIMIAIISIVSNLVLFGIFLYFWKVTADLALTRTIIFVGLGIDSLLYIYSVRTMRRMVWRINPFSNKYLNLALLLGWVLLIGAVYFPPLQLLLRTVALSWQHWLIMVLFGLLNVALIELVKGIFLVKNNHKIYAK